MNLEIKTIMNITMFKILFFNRKYKEDHFLEFSLIKL